MLINQLFEAYGAAAGVETIRQLIHAVKDGKDIDLKVGPEMTPITYPEARYLLGFFKANRHLGDGVAKYFGDPNWVIGKLEKRDAIQSPDRLNKFDIERMKDVQKDKVLDLEEIHVDHDDQRNNKKRMAEEAYKGWEYETDIIDYDDNRKISHTAKKGDQEVSIDWSPYSHMSDEEFKTWVDLDMPTRKDVDSVGPLSSEDLESMMKTKLGTKARLSQEGQLDEILPALGAMAGRAMVGRAASPLVKKVAGAAGSAVGSEIEKKFEEDSDVPPATRDYMTKVIAGKIKPGLDPDGSEFEEQAYLYHTSELGRRDLMAKGSNWKAYYDAIKWHYMNANESVEEAKKDDDVTKKLDPKTKVALKKQQMKTAGITKGDPIAAMAMGLEKDVDRLDKENDREEADIAAQDLVDKYHTQELEQLKKMLDSILKK